MAKFLDENGLSHFYSLLKSKFNKVDPATANPAMDGTVAVGASAKYAREDHVHPSDTSRAPTSHASTSTTYGKGTSSNYGHVKLSDSTSSTSGAASGGTAATPKAVSDAIAAAATAASAAYAPKNHASTSTDYGVGTTSNYGHVKLADSYDGLIDATTGTAATPAGVSAALTVGENYTNSQITAREGTATPLIDGGSGAVGTSEKFAREDHYHPTDTTRAPNNHLSTSNTYGVGNGTYYGHLKLIDATDMSAAAAATYDDDGGAAATPSMVYSFYDKALEHDDYGIRRALCTTGAATAAKAATTVRATKDGGGDSKITLTTGLSVLVTFQYGNTAATPTLNIDGTGAKSIAIGNSTGDGTTYNTWGAYDTLLVTYNGSEWVSNGSGTALRQAYKLANNAAPKASPALTGTPTAPTASAGTNTTQIATTAFVSTAITNAMTGSASFKGSLGSSTSTATYTQSTLEAAAYKAGWYLVVNSAGTYVGHACEVGDMVYCVKDKGSAYAASDFTVVQNEMDVLTNTEIDAIVNS